MKVYKFGGASVKDANAVRNLYSLLKDENSELIVVVSAMGKTTNRLENIWEKCISQKQVDAIHELEKVDLFHSKIIQNLDLSHDINLDVKVKSYLNELKEFICKNMNGIMPNNIKFIKNGREIKGSEILTYENIEFIIIPITCAKHI